jgi:hypothetical protein
VATDLEKLGEERRLIFENVANGVPTEQIMVAFRRSEADVMREVEFVARKIREYRFKRRLPPLACGTIKEIRWNRPALLDTVTKLGPRYLSSSLELPTIYIEALDHPGTIREVEQRTGQRVFS